MLEGFLQTPPLMPILPLAIADNEVSVDGYDNVRRDRPLNGRNQFGWVFFNEENKTFKFETRHVSATPVPSSVYGWNYNDEQ